MPLSPDRPRTPSKETGFPRFAGGAKVSAMRVPRISLCALSLLTAFTCLAAEPELQPLFNGKDLTNFKTEGEAQFWRGEGGGLNSQNGAAKKGNYLWTEKDYHDFVIEFDVRWKGTTPRGEDTGIEMRKPRIQLQLGISCSLKCDMSG